MIVLQSTYKKLQKSSEEQSDKILQLQQRLDSVTSEFRSSAKDFALFQQRYAPITSIETERQVIVEEIGKAKKDYNEKRNLLEHVVEKLDFYLEDLNAHDFGSYDLPEDLVSSGEYGIQLKDCKARINEWTKNWKNSLEKCCNSHALVGNDYVPLDAFPWFYFPREFNWPNYSEKNTAKCIVQNNQMHFFHYFSCQVDDIIKKTNLKNLARQKKKIEIAAAHVRTFCTGISLDESPVKSYSSWIKDEYYLDDINRDYLALKHEELELTHKLLLAKEDEKQRVREAKTAEREELAARKALEKVLKKENECEAELEKHRELLTDMHGDELRRLKDDIQNLERQLAIHTDEKKRAESMAQRTRAGYVYIISNMGSFGEDIVKIGMTRRLEPYDRVKELGDASVPFTFDTHALIYSEDAPALEAVLHKRFEEGRVNKVNMKKEFFRANIEDVKQAVMDLAVDAQFVTDKRSKEYFRSKQLATVNSENVRRNDIESLPMAV